MGRRRTGAKPYSVYADKGAAYISCTVARKRIRESLGIAWTDDRRSQGRIEDAAAARFASLVEGRVIDDSDPRIATSAALEQLVDEWLASCRTHYPATIELLRFHSDHFVAAFHRSIREAMADSAPQRFAMARLGVVLRSTVRKELSSLFNFYGWCKLHGHIRTLPDRAELAKGLRGVRKGRQRAKPELVTPGEALAIIAALPEWGAKGGRGQDPSKVAGAFRVRDYFAMLWETGLRPGTVTRLEAPKHWRRGWVHLHITEDIDKARYGRDVPLTKAAQSILTRCTPKAGGLIFGRHAYGAMAKRAAVEVIGQDRASRFAPYDLRHARATYLLAVSQDLLGVGFMLGHKQTTTTNRYLHAARDHADRTVALAELGSSLAANKSKTPPG